MWFHFEAFFPKGVVKLAFELLLLLEFPVESLHRIYLLKNAERHSVWTRVAESMP